MSEKKWVTDRLTQTDRQTDEANHSIVAHFVRVNYKMLDGRVLTGRHTERHSDMTKNMIIAHNYSCP